MVAPFRLKVNPEFRARACYPDAAREVINSEAMGSARAELRRWTDYRPTPLHRLDDLAAHCGVGVVWMKDESARFGLGSFKAIGGACGTLLAVQTHLKARYGVAAEAEDLCSGRYRDLTRRIVLTCATDGNHGRAVAWAARALGCACEVYVPSIVSQRRRSAIEALGAHVTRIAGTYDEALVAVARAAEAQGRVVVSDQAYPGQETVPRRIMQGYAVIAEEVVEELADAGGAARSDDRPPTHIFAQAGVGAFAAAICGHFWERFGPRRPRFLCVEPLAADCLYRSAEAGRRVTVPGSLETVMACLSCGEASPLAWQVLERGAFAFVAVADEAAVAAMRALARPRDSQRALVAGESGAAGAAGLLALSEDPHARQELGLDGSSRVLLFATEGATDPETYEELVGLPPDAVCRRREGGSTVG